MNKVHVKLVEEKELDIKGGVTSNSFAAIIFSDFEEEKIYFDDLEEMLKEWDCKNVYRNILEDDDLKYKFLETIELCSGFYFKVSRNYEWLEIEV